MPRKTPDAAVDPAASPPQPLARGVLTSSQTFRARPEYLDAGSRTRRKVIERLEAIRVEFADDKSFAAERCEKLGEDRLVDLVEDGAFMVEIAEALHTSRAGLHAWLINTGRKKLVDAAREQSAYIADFEAEEAIRALPVDATPAEVVKMRELVYHKRWQAKVRNQKIYGDKQELTVVDKPASEMTDAELDEAIEKKQIKLAALRRPSIALQ